MNSAGSSIFPCTNGTKNALVWPFRTIRFPCRRVVWLRWRRNSPLEIKAYQYDIVCNGLELSSGAIRNHRPDIMYKAFEIAGHSQREVDRKFGGMIRAFRYGAPPHGGIAPGIDRIVMLLADEPNMAMNECTGSTNGRAERGLA